MNGNQCFLRLWMEGTPQIVIIFGGGLHPVTNCTAQEVDITSNSTFRCEVLRVLGIRRKDQGQDHEWHLLVPRGISVCLYFPYLKQIYLDETNDACCPLIKPSCPLHLQGEAHPIFYSPNPMAHICRGKNSHPRSTDQDEAAMPGRWHFGARLGTKTRIWKSQIICRVCLPHPEHHLRVDQLIKIFPTPTLLKENGNCEAANTWKTMENTPRMKQEEWKYIKIRRKHQEAKQKCKKRETKHAQTVSPCFF